MHQLLVSLTRVHKKGGRKIGGIREERREGGREGDGGMREERREGE